MRLIDADALLKREHLYKADKIREDGSINREALQTIMAWEVKAMIDNSPTVNGELVGHAKWIEIIESDAPICSDCYGAAINTSGHFYHYSDFCPHCGAKMDLR